MDLCNSSNVIRIATLTPFKTEPYPNVRNIDGTPLKVMNAPILIALQQAFGVPFEIVMPEDDAFGIKMPDGQWTGLLGVIHRGEADFTVPGITYSLEKLEAVNLSFPMYVSDYTFMTNYPEPYPTYFAIFDSFSLEIWLCIGICLFLISFILYGLLKGKKSYSNVLVAIVGSLLEKSFSFEARQKNSIILLITWFLGTTVLISSYKAVILSVLTFPRMVGIRDITDLAKAAKENSVECMSYNDALTHFLWFDSDDERLQAIGECLKRSNAKSLIGHGEFFDYQGKKAFIADRLDMFERMFTSADSFAVSHFGIAYSKNFCCPRKLDSVVIRLIDAGLYPKTFRDREFRSRFYYKYYAPKEEEERILPLTLKDFAGAFIILLTGYVISILVMIAEIVTKKMQ